MALLTWDDTMSVACAAFDGQHKRLYALVNTLETGLREAPRSHALDCDIDQLILNVQTHFAAEEEMLRVRVYPGFFLHMLAHSAYLQSLFDLQRALRDGRTIHPVKVSAYLTDWLQNHILTMDKAYGPFLLGKN